MLSFALFLALSILSDGHAADTNKSEKAHQWQIISFSTTDGKMHPDFSLRPTDKEDSLALFIEFTGHKLTKGHGITAQLHRESGEAVNSVGGNLDDPSPAPVSKRPYLPGQPQPENMSWSATTTFPWGKNTLESGWIEVSLGDDRYWLEIPYGFDRNPHDPLPPAISGKGPKPDPALKTLGENDHIVQWQAVGYDFGTIQNGWGLTLNQSNDGDGASEVVLYRDDQAIEKSIYLWDMHSPRTQVHALDSDGTAVNSRCVNIHLDDDGFRRRDSFNLDRYGFDDERCWGQIEVSVDGKNYRLTIPSSLYKFMHGHYSK